MMNVKRYFAVKDIFYTIQGEGERAGSAAVFCRFTGCNGWSGRNEDRDKGPLPCSRWCDTDFVGGRRIYEDDLVASIIELFPIPGYRMVVFTGGEPALQLTDSLIMAVRAAAQCVAIETNGSLLLPESSRHCWITLSPKSEHVKQTRASELKLVYPTIDPGKFSYVSAPFRFLQPLHDANWQKNTAAAVQYVKQHPEWRLSLQTHKYIGIE